MVASYALYIGHGYAVGTEAAAVSCVASLACRALFDLRTIESFLLFWPSHFCIVYCDVLVDFGFDALHQLEVVFRPRFLSGCCVVIGSGLVVQQRALALQARNPSSLCGKKETSAGGIIGKAGLYLR